MATLTDHMGVMKSEEERQKANREKLDTLTNNYNQFRNYYEDEIRKIIEEQITEEFLLEKENIEQKYNSGYALQPSINYTPTDKRKSSYERHFYVYSDKLDLHYLPDRTKPGHDSNVKGWYITIKNATGLGSCSTTFLDCHFMAYYDPKNSNKFTIGTISYQQLIGSKTIENINHDAPYLRTMKDMYSNLNKILETWRTSLIRTISNANDELEKKIKNCNFDLPWEEANKTGEAAS